MAKEIEIDIKVDSKQAVDGVDKLGKSTDKLNKSTDGLKEATDNATDGLSNMGGALGTVGGGMLSALSGAKALAKGFIALALTPLGAVLVGISTAIIAVKTAFESSEEGQNKYNKLMTVLGALIGNLSDLLADFGEAIIEVFENPKESLISFANLLKENIVNRFVGMFELIPKLGLAVEQLFKGNFGEAGEIAVNAVSKVALGVEDMTGKIEAATEATKAFIKEQEREAGQAAEVANMRAKADKIERDLLVKKSELQSKVAQLRLKARQEDQFSAEERKAALIEAQDLENQLLDKETEFLELRRDAQILENTFSRSNKENLDLEAQAIAAVNNQVAARANVARQLQRELNTVDKQIQAREKAKANEAAKIQAAEDKLTEDKQKAEQAAEDKKLKLLEESQERALELKRAHKLRLAEEGLNDDNLTPDQIRERYEAVKVVEEEIRAAKLEKINENFEADLISQQERDALTIGVDKATSDAKANLDTQEANRFAAIEASKEEVRQHSLNAAVSGLKSLAALDEDNRALMAASLIAENVVGISRTIQSTIVANSKAVAAFPVTAGQPFVAINTASAALGIAASIKATQKGLAATKKGGSAGSAPNIPTGGNAPASAPSLNSETLFSSQNLQGNETEQIENNTGQNQIKAYVVESEITDTQNDILDFKTAAEIG